MSQDDMATVLAHEASHSLSHLLDRISMVSTVIIRYDTYGFTMPDATERIKLPCHLNGRLTEVRDYSCRYDRSY